VTTQMRQTVAGHVTSRKTCVPGLIPTKTTLIGSGIKVALQAVVPVLVGMQIIAQAVSYIDCRFTLMS